MTLQREALARVLSSYCPTSVFCLPRRLVSPSRCSVSHFAYFATTHRAAIVSCWAPLSWRPWEGNLAV
jgi:hypothetical protein